MKGIPRLKQAGDGAAQETARASSDSCSSEKQNVQGSDGSWEFMHPSFQRGCKHLLVGIKRRKDKFNTKNGQGVSMRTLLRAFVVTFRCCFDAPIPYGMSESISLRGVAEKSRVHAHGKIRSTLLGFKPPRCLCAENRREGTDAVKKFIEKRNRDVSSGVPCTSCRSVVQA